MEVVQGPFPQQVHWHPWEQQAVLLSVIIQDFRSLAPPCEEVSAERPNKRDFLPTAGHRPAMPLRTE